MNTNNSKAELCLKWAQDRQCFSTITLPWHAPNTTAHGNSTSTVKNFHTEPAKAKTLKTTYAEPSTETMTSSKYRKQRRTQRTWNNKSRPTPKPNNNHEQKQNNKISKNEDGNVKQMWPTLPPTARSHAHSNWTNIWTLSLHTLNLSSNNMTTR